MKGEENLIPFNQLTEDEQREIAKQGGIASGKARQEKARLRALLEIALNTKVGKLTREQKIVNNLISIAETKNKQAVKAFEVIRDTIGEKPTNKIEFGNDDTKITKIKIEIADGNTNENEEPILGEKVPKDE